MWNVYRFDIAFFLNEFLQAFNKSFPFRTNLWALGAIFFNALDTIELFFVDFARPPNIDPHFVLLVGSL